MRHALLRVAIIWQSTKKGQLQPGQCCCSNPGRNPHSFHQFQAKTSALNTTVAVALFVIDVPFKMMDKGVVLSYEGVDTLEDGQRVEVIKAIYNADKNDHHTKSDTWWYYFDADSGAYSGSMVYHAPTYAYIENTAKNEKLPLIMNTYRKIMHWLLFS